MSVLNLPKQKYVSTYIACYDTDNDESTFLKHVRNSDVIITQPITDDYRGKYYLSTSFIIKHAKQTTKIIIFDSCYFDFYYVDLTYKMIDNKIVDNPCPYHYSLMLDCFKNNISQQQYIENYVNNCNLKSSEELQIAAYNSLDNLNMRYENTKRNYTGDNVYIISIHDYVKVNYTEKLLFYSMNHPTKYVFQYICQEIISYLNIPNTIDYNIDPLANHKCILYDCIQKNVKFDISKCKPLINGLTDIYSITNLYYSAYQNLDSTKL